MDNILNAPILKFKSLNSDKKYNNLLTENLDSLLDSEDISLFDEDSIHSSDSLEQNEFIINNYHYSNNELNLITFNSYNTSNDVLFDINNIEIIFDNYSIQKISWKDNINNKYKNSLNNNCFKYCK